MMTQVEFGRSGDQKDVQTAKKISESEPSKFLTPDEAQTKKSVLLGEDDIRFIRFIHGS
jgi:hypothetical protein